MIRPRLQTRLRALAERPVDRLYARFPKGDSAVLVLIVGDDGSGQPGLVLTRRRDDMRTDPGFVAFPGGRIDDGETVDEAARRECEEEVGIAPEKIEIRGLLDETWNGAGYRIRPVVALTPGPVELTIGEAEVSAAAVVPLDCVISDDHHNTVATPIDGHDFLDDVIEFSHEATQWRLYGPTADIARDLSAWIRGEDRRQAERRQRELDHFATARWST